ncbi:MAG TPA: FliH/SctL family protein [Bryobacteraceae bacterium]|nr:FliH/SctL family protein [Bryobacteraceae bacterium]
MSSRIFRPGSGPGKEAQPIAWRRQGAFLAAREAPAEKDKPAKDIEARIAAAYERGRSDAAGQANARLDPVLAGFEGAIAELAGARKRFRAEAEEATVKLALAVARRVLNRELSCDPEAILGLVKAAFQKCDARETHRLRLSPADAETVIEFRDRLNFPPGLEIAADNSLSRGCAIFETSRGDLDASVETQLAEIERGFADVLKRRSQKTEVRSQNP